MEEKSTPQSDNPNPQIDISSAKEDSPEKKSYNLLISELRKAAFKHRRTGVLLTTCLVLAIVGITYAVNFVFIPNQARIINYQILLNNNPTYLVVYYLGRAIIFGSFFSGSMFFLYRLAKSSFDQSVRYRRRLNSILYKNYLFDSNIISKGTIKIEKIDDFVKLSEIFIKSESTAFSDKTNNESVKSVEGGKESFKFSSNDKNNEG